jgi:hypothetical protein
MKQTNKTNKQTNKTNSPTPASGPLQLDSLQHSSLIPSAAGPPESKQYKQIWNQPSIQTLKQTNNHTIKQTNNQTNN